MPDTTEIADVVEQFREMYGTTVHTVQDPASPTVALFATKPNGIAIHDLRQLVEGWRAQPSRRKGTATLRDQVSFIAHLTRYKQPSSVVFAAPDRGGPSLTAVYDYHPANGEHTDARHGEHRAHYPCALSEEWQAWAIANGKQLSQADFAAFLEERIFDVILPPSGEDVTKFTELLGSRIAGSAALMQLSRGLAVNVNTAVRQAVTLDTGEISVLYEETHTDGAGAPVKVPNLFFIGIPVFFGGPA